MSSSRPSLADRLDALAKNMPRRPILRWISPIPSSSSAPPSPDLRSLSEAMTEPIKAPAPARLPPKHFRPNNRPPPFLDNLTRSTLPTSSLSPPLPVSPPTSGFSSSIHSDIQRPAPIVLSHSSLTQTSLDTLRSVHRRSSTSSSGSRTFSSTSTTSQSSVLTSLEDAQQSATTSSWWWFPDSLTSSNKDHLLADEDKPANATSAQKQEHRDRKRTSPFRTPQLSLTPR